MRYGSLTRLLTVLALPIFIDTLLVMTLGAADTNVWPDFSIVLMLAGRLEIYPLILSFRK